MITIIFLIAVLVLSVQVFTLSWLRFMHQTNPNIGIMVCQNVWLVRLEIILAALCTTYIAWFLVVGSL